MLPLFRDARESRMRNAVVQYACAVYDCIIYASSAPPNPWPPYYYEANSFCLLCTQRH